jgi:hypothetical protein
LRRHTADSRASTNFLHHPARSLRRLISLLSTFGAVAGVQLQTSRSIKPRERDLGDLRLFVLVRFFTRPTNHPRHAACASNHKSKPDRTNQFNASGLYPAFNIGSCSPQPALSYRPSLPVEMPVSAAQLNRSPVECFPRSQNRLMEETNCDGPEGPPVKLPPHSSTNRS